MRMGLVPKTIGLSLLGGAAALTLGSTPASATSILFVGNSFTFGEPAGARPLSNTSSRAR